MQTLKRVLSYTKKYWKRLLISGITAALYGLFAAAPTYALKHTVDDIFVKQLNHLLIPFIFLFVSLFALKGLFMFLSNYYMNWVGNRVVNDIRNDLFEKVIRFPIAFYKEKTTGQLMSHFLNDTQMIQNASSSAIKNGIRSFFEAIFLLGVALSQNFKLALIMMLVGPVIGIIIKRMGRSIKKASISIQKEMGNISSAFQETFVGIREIKVFNSEKTETNRISKLLQRCFKSIMKNVQIESTAPAFVESVAMIGGGFVFYIAAHQIMRGEITAGQLTAFFASIVLSYQPMKRLINVYAETQYGLAAADRIFEVMDKVYPENQNRTSTLAKFEKNIEFKNVAFSYGNSSEETFNVEVFKNINLKIKKGESIGIMGPSGAGKSTLCDLLLSFITPTKGQIFIDEQDISFATLKSIRSKIGYVGQKTFLFSGTIMSNIAYSKPTATKEEIINACKAAHADEFINQLPNGYNTLVGENGSKLSGGQKQRITIARALLKDPEIIIFDEATSSLDRHSENMIKQTLEELQNKKTIIVISHRLSFLERMNRIVKIENGFIEEVNKIKMLHNPTAARGFIQ